MNSANKVNELVSGWISQGLSKSEILVRAAEAEIGWSYVWGATGQNCTTAQRQAMIKRESEDEANQTVKNCQVLNGSRSVCDGCKYYPNGERTLIDDCQGFVKQICKRIGITFKGGGCTTMWDSASNWTQKGDISTLPETVCCVFWTDKKNPEVKSHIGFYIGNGMMIHCSGEVKKEKLSSKCTDWAIPVGLDGSVPIEKPTLKRGSVGTYVSLLQTMLIQRGYDLSPYGADGKFGAKTEAAVKAFQGANGLKQDGICGKATWTALENVEPTKFYTVTVPHVQYSIAQAIKAQYPNAIIAEE